MRVACAFLFVSCFVLARCDKKNKDVAPIETTPAAKQTSAAMTPPKDDVPETMAEFKTPAPEPGFELLFNGSDLKNWRVDGDEGAFTVVSGTIKCAAFEGKPQRGWLYTRKEFKNYDLRLEFMLRAKAESGVAPQGKYGLHQQLEVQLRDDVGLSFDMPTGGLIFSGKDILPPQKAPTMKSLGEWNELRIVTKGAVLTVWINGEQVLQQDQSKVSLEGIKGDKGWASHNLSHRDGAIGLQVNGKPATYFRNLRIKPQ